MFPHLLLSPLLPSLLFYLYLISFPLLLSFCLFSSHLSFTLPTHTYFLFPFVPSFPFLLFICFLVFSPSLSFHLSFLSYPYFLSSLSILISFPIHFSCLLSLSFLPWFLSYSFLLSSLLSVFPFLSYHFLSSPVFSYSLIPSLFISLLTFFNFSPSFSCLLSASRG